MWLAGSSCRASPFACLANQGWHIYQGGSAELTIDSDTLNAAFAKATYAHR